MYEGHVFGCRIGVMPDRVVGCSLVAFSGVVFEFYFLSPLVEMRTWFLWWVSWWPISRVVFDVGYLLCSGCCLLLRHGGKLSPFILIFSLVLVGYVMLTWGDRLLSCSQIVGRASLLCC